MIVEVNAACQPRRSDTIAYRNGGAPQRSAKSDTSEQRRDR